MILVAVSTGHFDPLIEACSRLGSRYAFLGQIGSGTVVPPFPHFRTAPPEEIERRMAEAELVVTHAGTGMLSQLYRLTKRTVVVPKQSRYGESNDGQVELARKWAELGICTLCMDVDRLGEAIEKCRESTPHFPRLPSLGAHFRDLLGLSSVSAGVSSRGK